jgi:outer membrane protein
MTYSVLELIDLAESHNPKTRAAWERARAQAAAWGVARSELYPTVAATPPEVTRSSARDCYIRAACQNSERSHDIDLTVKSLA